MTPEQMVYKREIPQTAVAVGGLAGQFSSSKQPLLSGAGVPSHWDPSLLGSLPPATVQGARYHTDTQDRVFVKRTLIWSDLGTGQHLHRKSNLPM